MTHRQGPARHPGYGRLLRQPLDDILPRLCLAQAHCGDLYIIRRIAPRLRLLETIEHADDDPWLGRFAFDADVVTAADQIATTERLDGRLGMRRVVALERRHVAGDIELGNDIGLGRARRFSSRDRRSAHGGTENRGQRGNVIGFDQWRLHSVRGCGLVTPSWTYAERATVCRVRAVPTGYGSVGTRSCHRAGRRPDPLACVPGMALMQEVEVLCGPW